MHQAGGSNLQRLARPRLDRLRLRMQQRAPPSAFDSASWLSKAFFIWPGPLIALGAKKPLEQEDLPDVSRLDEASYLSKKLVDAWETQDPRNKSFARALFSAFISTNGPAGLFLFFQTWAKVAQAYFLGRLVKSFEGGGDDGTLLSNGYFLSFLVVVLGVCVTMTHHHFYFHAWRFGMNLRIAASVFIYQKALKLHLQSLTSMATGRVVNMMSVDVEKFQWAGTYCHYAWHGIYEAIAVLIFGYFQLGVSFVVGYAMILLLVPAQAYMSKRFGTLRTQVGEITDKRVKLTNQAISGARQLKVSGWELQFQDAIQEARRKEVGIIVKANTLRAINEAVFFVAQGVVAFVTFVTYWGLGNTLSSEKVFTTLLLFAIVQFGMTKFFPLAVQTVSEGLASARRIQEMLVLDEVQTTRAIDGDDPVDHQLSEEGVKAVELTAIDSHADDVRISLESFTGSWKGEDGPATLSHVDFEVRQGELVAVVGPVGASKSSLLMAILQELTPNVGGSVFVRGKVAYASQEPWIQSKTLRENILFGQPFDEDRYRSVVRACALRSDLKLLPEGDETMIGDRGVNLSGGQRARIALARMLYTSADIYLMDDPLSAVDPAVGRHLFDQVVCGALHGTTRVLVTHQLQYLSSPLVTRIVVMEGGKIVANGSYAELSEQGVLARTLATEDDDAVGVVGPREKSHSVAQKADEQQQSKYDGRSSIIVAEDKSTGKLTSQTYLEYARSAGGMGVVLGVLGLLALSQVTVMVANIWLSSWAEMSKSAQDRFWIVQAYIIITAVSIVVSVVRSVAGFRVLILAARHLHNDMLASVLRAPLSFYDANPLGRVLNRFSKDLGFLDDKLPETWFDFLQCLLMVIGSVVLICIVNPYVCVVIAPLALYFYLLRVHFLKTSREVKRLEAVSRSPVFSFLSESLDGLPIIRGFGASAEFVRGFIDTVNANTQGYFAFVATSRWLGFRLDVICIALLIAATFLSVVVHESDGIEIDPGLLGLSIVYIIQLTGLFQWMVRQSVEVENQMVSVERIVSYCHILPEAPLESAPEHKPPPEWPSKGSVVARDLVLRYRPDLPPVLRGLSFEIPGGQRVGIVGRTGAGKSSLISTFFRLVEIEKGVLSIDGVNIATLGLHDLRKKLCVIPQTPFLFSGSIRQNLDPFGAFEDAQLWSALDHVQLRPLISSLPFGLQTEVSDSGSNFSVGQRQLLCLARAILQHSKILLMDEATANVDLDTDRMIQHAVRTKFSSCTVVMIAHRLHTVIDSDKILVLSDGQLVEDGHPHELLAKCFGEPDFEVEEHVMQALRDHKMTVADVDLGSQAPALNVTADQTAPGSFASMVLETGPSTAETLRRLACLHYRASVSGQVEPENEPGLA